jgi:hypothetical protein
MGAWHPVQALKQVFDVDTNIDVIKHHGSTDPLILVSVLAHHGIPHDQVKFRPLVALHRLCLSLQHLHSNCAALSFSTAVLVPQWAPRGVDDRCSSVAIGS